MPAPELERRLSLWDAVMLNVGTIIGSGIFFVPAVIAAHLPATGPVLAVWILGGIVSLFGALTIAELGAAMPRAGGQVVYLHKAFGPLWGFLYGWTSLAVINTAAIAAVAVAAATYLAHFFPFSPGQIKLLAILSILFLTGINILGVIWGARVQNLFTLAKVFAILALIFFCFALGEPSQPFTPLLLSTPGQGWSSPLALAMIAVLWSYDGWIEITYVAGEVKQPQRNLPLALAWSTVIIIVIYLLINLAFLYVLSPGGMVGAERVAADAATVVLGSAGAAWVAAAVVVSTFGANNGFILGASRIYYAMARNGLFFSVFGRIHKTRHTPVISLAVQAAWACVLVLSGTFEQLFTYVVFASWFFYALSAAAVIRLRVIAPDMDRPYKVWGYPVTPLLFLGFCLWLVVSAILENPSNALIGIAIMISGFVLYFLRPKNGQAGEEDNL